MKNLTITLIKAIVIVIAWSFLFVIHQEQIKSIQSDPALTLGPKSVAIIRQLMGIDYRPNQGEDNAPTLLENNQTSSSPRVLDLNVIESNNFQHALQIAEQFNQSINLDLLNQYFIDNLNEKRSQFQWKPLYIGDHLKNGAVQRSEELASFHYLNSNTIEGKNFRSLFPLEDAEYRLGENLYELYMSSDDIHMTTWQNPEILANYLINTFESMTESEHYEFYSSAYLSIKANASDYLINSNSYVRLVVVLVMDTY